LIGIPVAYRYCAHRVVTSWLCAGDAWSLPKATR